MTSFTALERFRLTDRVILVTGATGHLGRPIARAISLAGGTPIIAGRSSDKLSILAGELRAAAPNCLTLAFDVGEPRQCREAVAELAARAGKLSGIVNCAYHPRAATIETTRDEDFTSACNQNLAGPFAIVQSALPLLREAGRTVAGGASIVNVASMYAHVSPDPRIYGDSGRNNPPHYGSTKAGLVQLTRYLAAHLGPDGIRVNSVSPGPFPPPSIEQTDPQFHAYLAGKTPLGRIGLAEELVGPVLFLLSAAASFVTGTDLAVDGGWTAW
jgi:NAD(P)-dependent dehydrogenase (short-subunit alcohol dehydrogenase family)